MKHARLEVPFTRHGSLRSRSAAKSSTRGGMPLAGNAGRYSRNLCAAILLTAFLPACAMEGDFGRPQTYSFLGYPLDATYWASDAAHISGPRRYSLTPDEIAMRDTGYRLRIQVHNLTPVKLAYAPESAYAGQLKYEKRTFGPARATLFDQELRNDHDALTRFGAAARRVLVADRDRLNALLENSSYLTRGEKRHARNRMRSNFAFIEGTFIDLQQRIASYDHAIDRSRIETPGTSLAAAEGALNHLRDRAAALHYELSQAYRVNARHAHEYRPDGGIYKYERKMHKRIEKRALESGPRPLYPQPKPYGAAVPYK